MRQVHVRAALLAAAACTLGCPPPPDDNPDALALDPAIELQVGLFDPDTASCSTPEAPNRGPMVVRQPAADETYPVFLFLPGTGRAPDNPSALAILERAAGRGFVAASADYASTKGLFPAPTPCWNGEGKASCTFPVDDADAPEAALNLLCNDLTVDGAAAGIKADCGKGVVVAGFSQGGTVALLAADENADVRAAWVMGFHDQAIVDGSPMTCVHHDERVLPQDALRLMVGESDWVMRGPHQPHMEDVTGRTCAAGTAQCFDDDAGWGWGLVPDTECATGTCGHEFLDDANFWTDRWWGASANLAWLAERVDE